MGGICECKGVLYCLFLRHGFRRKWHFIAYINGKLLSIRILNDLHIMYIKWRKNVKHFTNNLKQSSQDFARNEFQERFLHHFFFLKKKKSREMKGRRSIRQNLLWDWDGIFDNIISRYLREQTEWAKNGEGGRGVEITSWNDGLQTKSKCRLWLAGTTTRPSLWVWGHDTSSVHVVPASPKKKRRPRKVLVLKCVPR